MTTGCIRVLKPNVSQEEALRAFSAAGFSTWYWRLCSGPLRRIADVYVQYFLFRVKCGNARPRLFAIDAVDGSLDLFEFPRIPDDRELLALGGRNRLEATLSEGDRKSTRLNSSHTVISYAVFCLKKKKNT